MRDTGEQVGHEVGVAALPRFPSEYRGDGVIQPLMGIRGDQLHPDRPSPAGVLARVPTRAFPSPRVPDPALAL